MSFGKLRSGLSVSVIAITAIMLSIIQTYLYSPVYAAEAIQPSEDSRLMAFFATS